MASLAKNGEGRAKCLTITNGLDEESVRCRMAKFNVIIMDGHDH